ncbi:hypothetical protein GCM10010277_08270 [Streptomyces longisporoflavus]|nr:hypothetical protein GCM10010277_08270 [Streptomyces longisporoflavus]
MSRVPVALPVSALLVIAQASLSRVGRSGRAGGTSPIARQAEHEAIAEYPAGFGVLPDGLLPRIGPSPLRHAFSQDLQGG